MKITGVERKFWRGIAALGLLFAVSQAAQASMYGCKVLLCLSNPNGAKAADNCPPPIDQLYDDLAHGRDFPTCDKSDGNDGTSYARPTYAPFDPCPAGTTAAPSGAYVVQGSTKGANGWGADSYNIDGQVAKSASESDYGLQDSGGATALACVANPVGAYQVYDWATDTSYNVSVYSQVIWQQPKSPRAIDVYINNSLWKRVHW